MAQRVTGDLKDGLLGQLFEIERQIRQSSGYPFDPLALKGHLQDGIEGRFVRKSSSLLEPLGLIAVPAVKKFSVRKSFAVNTSANAAVKIFYVSDNFREWFGDMVETDVSGEILRYAKLQKPSLDALILREFGSIYEVRPSHIFSLMRLQPNGENGALLTDGCANIFYARDSFGSLHVVVVYWNCGGWGVRVYSDASQYAGTRVFSSNSSGTVAV